MRAAAAARPHAFRRVVGMNDAEEARPRSKIISTMAVFTEIAFCSHGGGFPMRMPKNLVAVLATIACVALLLQACVLYSAEVQQQERKVIWRPAQHEQVKRKATIPPPVLASPPPTPLVWNPLPRNIPYYHTLFIE